MNQFFYVSSPDSQQIYVWKMNDYKENLDLIQIVNTPGNVQPIVIHPNQQFLYAGIRPSFGILTYQIHHNGLLSEIQNNKIFISPTYLTINAAGTFLYCVSYNYNTINVFPISNVGMLNQPIQIINGLLGCHSAKINETGESLWIPCLKEQVIKLFSINTNTGMLIPNNPNHIIVNADSGPRHIIFHYSSRYAYIINELNGTISVIQYDSKITKPTVIQTINILPNHSNIQKFWSADIHITPDNSWLYCSDRFNNTISCFKILSKTKQLKFIRYHLTEIQPRGFVVDVTGQFLIVAGQKSNNIALYRINQNNGKLYIISRYFSGIGPLWISVLSIPHK